MTNAELVALRCGLDRVAFARRLGLEPIEWQRRILRSESRRLVLSASRQAGKSTLTAIRALHTAVYRPGSTVLIVAPSERQSRLLFDKVAGFARRLGNDAPATADDRKTGLVLENGSRIEALPGKERTIRGFSAVALLVVDEAARAEESLFEGVTPMLAASGGAMILLSSPYTPAGFFYRTWREGDAWERHKVTWRDCPWLDPADIAEERARMPGYVFRREYGGEFTSPDDAYFNPELVAASVSSGVSAIFGGRKTA